MARVTVKVDLKKLREVAKAVQDQGGPLRKVYKQWAARYRGFLHERFDTFSKGGGDWAPLAEATKKGRKRKGTPKKGKKQRFSILRDTGMLFAALQPAFVGQPGALEEEVPFGVRVGFGGPASHGEDSMITVADIAAFHQAGGPNLPQRMIIVGPDQELLDDMAGDMARAIKDL